MKTQVLLTGLSMLIGAVMGAVGVGVLHAQSKPPAYVITEFSDIMDGKALGVARDKMAAAVANAGGKLLVRTDKVISLEGTAPKIFAVISFDGVDQAKAWYSSDAMKASNEARHKASKSRAFVVEGLAK